MLVKNQCLTSVDAAHDGIDSVAATTICHALQGDNRTLTSLELSHNPLGRKGTEQIMAALTENPVLTTIGLQHTLAGLGDIRQKLGGGENSHGGAALAFDPESPEGRYNLDLSKPWERWVATKLQQLALQLLARAQQRARALRTHREALEACRGLRPPSSAATALRALERRGRG